MFVLAMPVDISSTAIAVASVAVVIAADLNFAQLFTNKSYLKIAEKLVLIDPVEQKF